MNYLEFVNNLKINLRNDLKFNAIKFFTKNNVSFWVWVIVIEHYYKDNKDCYIEDIINEIPKEYASRPTIFKFIDDAVAKKYFEKKQHHKDKRKYNLSPSLQTIREFEEWAKVFSGF